MGDIRLIAMDMDGTLLHAGEKAISPGNVRALKRASQRGVRLALATGRLPDDAAFFALDAGLPMHILAINGSVRVDAPLGEIVSAAFIPEREAREICRMIRALGLRFAVCSLHEVAFSAPPEDHEAARRTQGTHLFRPGARIRLWMDGNVDRLIGRVNKFSVITPELGKLARLRAQVERHIPGAEVTSSWYDNIEIIPRGVNKGSATAALAASLGIPMAGVMAIGDQDNDVSMIAAAGCGVAVANGSPAARAAARCITASNEQDGVARVIERLVLSDLK